MRIPGETGNRTAGTVIARNPLRKDQGHRAWLGWNVQPGMIDISWSIGEINVQANRLCGRAGTRKHQEAPTISRRERRNHCNSGEPTISLRKLPALKSKPRAYRKRRQIRNRRYVQQVL